MKKVLMILMMLVGVTLSANNYFVGLITVDGIPLNGQHIRMISKNYKLGDYINYHSAEFQPFGDPALDFRKDINYKMLVPVMTVDTIIEIQIVKDNNPYAEYSYKLEYPIILYRPTTKDVITNVSHNFTSKVSISETPTTLKLDMNTIQPSIKVFDIRGRLIKEVSNMSFNGCKDIEAPNGVYVAMVNNVRYKFNK